MADGNIFQITLPDGSTYNLKDVDFESYAPKASPALTGTPTAPTAANGTDTTQIATTAFVQNAISGLGSGTVTSVGLANMTNGGLSISGSPITSSGTFSIGHTNILASSQATQAIYPITIDKNGHIESFGSAVTIPAPGLEKSYTSGTFSGIAHWDNMLEIGASTSSESTTMYLTDYGFQVMTNDYSFQVNNYDGLGYSYSGSYVGFPTPSNESDMLALVSDIPLDWVSTTTTLASNAWSSNLQTKTISGITTTNTVIVSPSPSSYGDYCEAGVYCSSQGTNSLTFTCDEAPSVALTVNILYREEGLQ